MKIKSTSLFHHFHGMKHILRVGLKSGYCKYDDLDECSNMFLNLSDNLDDENLLQEKMQH